MKSRVGESPIYRLVQAWLSFRQCPGLYFHLGNKWILIEAAILPSLTFSQWAAISQLGLFALPLMKTHTVPPQTELRKRNLTSSLPNTRHPSMPVNKWGSVGSELPSPLHFSFTFSKESLCLKWTFCKPEIEHQSRSIWMILFEGILLLEEQGLSALYWDPTVPISHNVKWTVPLRKRFSPKPIWHTNWRQQMLAK